MCQRRLDCPDCHGKGLVHSPSGKVGVYCPRCSGRGHHDIPVSLSEALAALGVPLPAVAGLVDGGLLFGPAGEAETRSPRHWPRDPTRIGSLFQAAWDEGVMPEDLARDLGCRMELLLDLARLPRPDPAAWADSCESRAMGFGINPIRLDGVLRRCLAIERERAGAPGDASGEKEAA